jgi:signal transduction histidine kinase
VFNLCLNARDAMIPAGGMLELTTSVKKTTVEFSVRDTGKGMSEKRLGSLWKPRLSPDRKHGHGLQIVRVSIARMGGTIDVQSKVGVGTTFTISLPALA